MINVKNLEHYFRENEPVFKQLSFKIKEKERILLTGANGSGKTTLLKVLAGQLIPINGEITIDGFSTQKLEAKKGIAYVPSSTEGLFPRLTVRENIQLLSRLLKIPTDQNEKILQKWQKLPALKKGFNTPFYQCSTGMKKLALLAALTLHNPTYILADELFENIDQNNEKMIASILEEHFAECTLILTSHRKITNVIRFNQKWRLENGVISVS